MKLKKRDSIPITGKAWRGEMKYIDFLELPQVPNFLRFKGKKEFCFPIRNLPDNEIKLLFKRMAEKAIARKKGKEKIATQDTAEADYIASLRIKCQKKGSF